MGLQGLVLGHIISRSSRDPDPEPDERSPDLPEDHFGDDNEEDLELHEEHNDNDIIHEIDFESHGPDPPVRKPRGHRFRRHLSLSGFSTLSSTGPVIRHRAPPEWFKKLTSYFPKPKSGLERTSFIPNYRLTPIISGIVIPFSILLEIPGLTEHWYIRTVSNQTVESKPNSTLLVIGQALSVTCAVAANACLVVRFMERRVKTMTLICIALLTAHDIINIVTVTIFGASHSFNDGFTYGPAFWFTVCSTAASMFTNITLVVDLVRTPNFSRSGSGLTGKQRSLVIVVIILLCYIAFGALINSVLIHLSFVDALYFSVVTIETIGFGDIVPRSTSARVFDCVYATFGILNVALMIGLMRETVLETLEVGYRIRMRKLRQWRRLLRTRRRVEQRWRVAIAWRLREEHARMWVKDIRKTDTGISRLLCKVFDRVNWLWAKNGNAQHEYGLHGLGYGFGNHPIGMHLNLEALTPAQLEAAALEAGVPLETLLPPNFKGRAKAPDSPFEMLSGDGETNRAIPLTHARLGRMVTMLSRFALALHSSGPPPSEPQDIRHKSEREKEKSVEETHEEETHEEGHETLPMDDLDAPQNDNDNVPVQNLNAGRTSRRGLVLWQDNALRSKAESEERKAFYVRLALAWILFIVFWTIGSAIFMVTEGWTYGIAMYFCFVAFTTIGYGDYYPDTPAGRSIFVVWALLGTGTMTILISVLSEAYSYRYKHAMHTHVFDKAVKRYRQTHIDKPPVLTPWTASTLASSKLDASSGLHIDTHVALSESETRVRQQLEALPNEILQTIGSFSEHVEYFVRAHATGAAAGGDNNAEVAAPVPEGMKQLLDDITGEERITDMIKNEIMQDEDARRTLFRLGVEKAMRQMIDAAEGALDSVKERNNLVMLHEQRSRNELRHKGLHRDSDWEESPTLDPNSPSSADYYGDSPTLP